MNKLHKLIREELAKVLNEDSNDFESDEFLNADNPEQSEPDEEDCFVESNGFKLSVSCGGKFIGEFTEDEDAYKAVRNWKKKNNWSPNTWFVSDHGNVMLVDDNGNEIKENVVKEDMYSQISAGMIAVSLILTFAPMVAKSSLKFWNSVADSGGVVNLYKKWKNDTGVQPILDRLSKDSEVVNHLKTKGTKGIRNIINSKLLDNEKQYINKVYGQDIQMIIRKAEREKSI